MIQTLHVHDTLKHNTWNRARCWPATAGSDWPWHSNMLAEASARMERGSLWWRQRLTTSLSALLACANSCWALLLLCSVTHKKHIQINILIQFQIQCKYKSIIISLTFKRYHYVTFKMLANIFSFYIPFHKMDRFDFLHWWSHKLL